MNGEAVVRAAFLLITMSIAGVFHVLWLSSRLSQRFAWPVDAGIEFRGRPLFGENKRVCGFMVLPPVAALAFMLVGGYRDHFPAAVGNGLWALTVWQYAGLGLLCGMTFMLVELPNSFMKRRLGIAPGQPPSRSRLRAVILLIDRYDSVLGVLIVMSLLVPVPIATWILVLAFGPVVHATFSITMHALGIKARAL